MSAFTDTDLKRLKEDVHEKGLKSWFDLDALLARLSAAEACVPYHECQDDMEECSHLKAWRKASGKAGK